MHPKAQTAETHNKLERMEDKEWDRGREGVWYNGLNVKYYFNLDGHV